MNGCSGSVSIAGEQRGDLVVLLVADGAEQGRRGDLALAVDLDPELVLVVRLELEPGAAVRDDLGAEQHPAGRRVLELAVVDAGRADELADDDALGAVDDERALVGHPRVVAHVDPLALDLAGLLDQELDVDVQRPGERQVLRPALLLGVLRVAELVVEELELHHLAGEVLDRADLVEQLPEALLDEPLERIELELDQVRDREDFGDPGIARARQRRAVRFDDSADSMKHRSLTEAWGKGKGRAHRRSRIPRFRGLSNERRPVDERGPLRPRLSAVGMAATTVGATAAAIASARACAGGAAGPPMRRRAGTS